MCLSERFVSVHPHVFVSLVSFHLVHNHTALKKLRTACQNVKHELSQSMEATIEVDSLADGEDLYDTLSRAEFEDMCDDIWERMMEPVTKAITDAGLAKHDVHEVVLIGGRLRCPVTSPPVALEGALACALCCRSVRSTSRSSSR